MCREPTAEWASDGAGSSVREPPSQTHPPLCPLQGRVREQKLEHTKNHIYPFIFVLKTICVQTMLLFSGFDPDPNDGQCFEIETNLNNWNEKHLWASLKSQTTLKLNQIILTQQHYITPMLRFHCMRKL